jgi:hypothetical protein
MFGLVVSDMLVGTYRGHEGNDSHASNGCLGLGNPIGLTVFNHFGL